MPERATATIACGRSVTVEVPATSANLGPGFDCFALALDWRDAVTLTITEAGFRADVTGEGADTVPTDRSHLIIASALVGLADLGIEAAGLSLAGHNTIPHGRGLGSSSAAIVAGLAGAAALAGAEPDPAWLVRHAAAIEGHPDNVAAAVHGGFVLAYVDEGYVRVAQAEVAEEIAAVAYVAPAAVATKTARGLLPDTVPHAEAAADAGRAGLLVHALRSAPELLLAATRDWLHQDYRRPAMAESYALLSRLRAEGYAAVISGAGPTVLVLGRSEDLAGLDDVPGFTAHRVRPGPGVRILERGI